MSGRLFVISVRIFTLLPNFASRWKKPTGLDWDQGNLLSAGSINHVSIMAMQGEHKQRFLSSWPVRSRR
jgi:hypothetical protein